MNTTCKSIELVRELGQIEYGKTGVKERNRTDSLGREGILAGVRVLDFSRVLAGPYATRILADFGAEVIKVQSRKTATGAEDNNGPYFKAWNRNKRSVTLDMSAPWSERNGPETRVH